MITHLKKLIFGIIAVTHCQIFSQDFDEKFDHWPVDLKINGTIVIHNNLEDHTVIDRACRQFSSQRPKTKEKLRVVVLSNRDSKKLSLKDTKSLSIFAEDSAIFNVDDVDKPDFEKSASDSGMVIVHFDPGFVPTPEEVKKAGRVLDKFLKQKGLIVTDHNGAKWFSRFCVKQTENQFSIQKGMHLVPDSIIETEFEKEADEKRVRSVLAIYPRTVGIGVGQNSCLILRGRKLFAFQTGEAKFMLAANDRLPQRNHKIGAKREKRNRFDFENNLVDLTEWRRDAIDRTLPPFPPTNPKTPNVENGTLVIVGGGGMPSGLMETIVKMAGGKNSRMVYVPCWEQDTIDGPQRTVEYWKKLGVKSATFIHTKDRNKANTDEEFLKPLKDATGIWFGGGRQWNFSDSYYGTRAHKLMKDVLKRGGVIGGSSAGASIQARYLARATPIANYRIMAPGYERGGLGFISGVAIDQHFSQRGRQKDMTQLMATHPQLLGIGIDEATAIIVNKSIAKVVGRGKVHFYDRKKPVYPDRPDYVALAKGETFDLAKRTVISNKEDKKDPPPTNGKKNTDKKSDDSN